MRQYDVIRAKAAHERLREQLRQADREEQWALRTGFNPMCYACRRECKTRNKTWNNCIKREVE